MTRAEIAEREATERRRKEEEVAERKRAIEAQQEAARLEAQRKKEEAEQRALEAKRIEQERLNALARQRQEELLRQNAEKQRQAELQQAAKQKQQELQRMTGTSQGSCDYQKIVAISKGQNPDSVVCGSPVPKQQSAPVAAPALSDRQLQYLQQNAVSLQPPALVPEQRTISLQPGSIAAPTFPVCSTFKDPALPKNGCPSVQASQPEAAPAGQVKPDEQAAKYDPFHNPTPSAGTTGQQPDIIGTLCKKEEKEDCSASGISLFWWTGCTPAVTSQSGDITTPERGKWCQKSTRNWVYEKSLIGAPNCHPGEWTKQEQVCQPKSYKPQPDMVFPVLR